MITRAQAEALLTLAESLEACERQGVTFLSSGNFHLDFRHEGFDVTQGLAGEVTSVGLRFAVNALVPKHTGS